MSRTVTLNLPEELYDPIARMALATNQPVETVLLTALQVSLPPLEGLSPEVAEELARLETLTDEALWAILAETVPADQQQRLDELLRLNQAGTLPGADGERLADLQRAADLVMLRKARAAVLLRFRGYRLPTLDELRQLTFPAQ